MDKLFNWGFDAMDRMISPRHTGRGEPTCPGGTYTAGYVMDAWKDWRVLCLSALSIEDVEDVYLLAIMLTGHLITGVCFAMIYWKIRMMKSVIRHEVKTTTEVLLKSMQMKLEEMSGKVKINNEVLQTSMIVNMGHMSDDIQVKMIHKLEFIREQLITQLQDGAGRRKIEADTLLANMTEVFQKQIRWNLDLILRKLTRQRRDTKMAARYRRDGEGGALVPIRQRREAVARADSSADSTEE